jgi:hypothetical protein
MILSVRLKCTDNSVISVCMTAADISPALRTLFADLTQQVATAPPAGTVYRRTRDGVEYIYAKVPVGTDRVDRFIGKAGDAQAEIEANRLQQGMALARERRRLVSMLRHNGFAGPDRTLGAALDALAQAGLFEGGAVLVGTAAYLVSEGVTGSRLPASLSMTGDLDLATASLELTAAPPEALADILRRADRSFEPVMPLNPKQPAARFRNAEGYLVDLVTPMRRRDQPAPAPLPALEAGAMPLQHMAWLIADPVRTVALWGAGVPVTVPQPAKYAVHKLILAQKREAADRLKRTKDLAQGQAMIEALLRHDPFGLEDTIAEARAQGDKGWARPLNRSLREVDLTEVLDF